MAKRRRATVPEYFDCNAIDREWTAPESLRSLGNLLQERVHKWNYPESHEVDDERPDFAEIREHRYWYSFERPLDEDLARVDFVRLLTWLGIHAPGIVPDVQGRIESLAVQFPLARHADVSPLLNELADTGWHLIKVAEDLRQSIGEPAATTRPKPKKKSPGRPKADYDQQQWEAELVEDWKRAHECGAYKPEWAKEHGMTEDELEIILGRVRKRKLRERRRRADN